MKKIKITTPENIEVEYNLADIGSRTAAAIIDFLIQGAMVLMIIIPIIIIVCISPWLWIKYYGWFIGISVLIYTIINYGYFIVSELTMNGRTIGKRVLKIRAIRSNGEPITIKHSAIRNLFKVLVDVFGIGVVMIFFSKDKKRIGDFAASTIVVTEAIETELVTLESLENVIPNLNYYLSKEELELLREYYKRKSTMENYSTLKEEIKEYFYIRFQKLDILNEWNDFVNQL